MFDLHYSRIYRYLDRLTGEPELAADLAQEVFIKLYRRGSLPQQPQAWLITVALNLFRNAMSSGARRKQLLTVERGARVHSDPLDNPGADAYAKAVRSRVRAALDGLPERERSMLLLHAEGYSYREIATALDLNEASVGTLLARARTAFRTTYQGPIDAS